MNIFKKALWITVLMTMISMLISPYLTAQNSETEFLLTKEDETKNESAIDASTFTLKNKASTTDKNSFNLLPETLQIEQNVHKYFQKRLKLEKIEKSFFTASLVSILALNVADYISTRKALKYEGVSEGNSFLKPFVNNDLAFLAVKMGLTAGNHYLMQKLHKSNKTLAWIVSIASNFVLSYVVVNNFKIIQNMKT